MTTTALLLALLLGPTPSGGMPSVMPQIEAGDKDLDGGYLYADQVDDPNTYICGSAADTWAIVAGGTTSLTVTSSLVTLGVALNQNAVTIADGDATPDVSGGNLFVTSANTGATAITDLDNPTVGQVLSICGGSNTNSSTITDGGNFALNGDMTLALDECIVLEVQADNDYVERGRNNVSLTPWTETIDADGNDLKNVDDIYGEAADSDAAGRVGVFQTSEACYPAIDATNNDGANTIIAAQPGAEEIDGVTRAGTTGDTITFSYVLNDGTVSSVTLTEGTDYDCDGAADDATCVCNLYTAVTGHGTLGTTVNTQRTDGTCSDEQLWFGIVPGTSVWLDVAGSDETNTSFTHGSDGDVIIPVSNAEGFYFLTNSTHPMLTFGGTSNSYAGIKEWGAELHIRKADDSGYAKLTASTITSTDGFVAKGYTEFDVLTISADDTTPDVSGSTLFYTSDNTGTTVITDLDSPEVESLIVICIGGTGANASTISDGGNFNLEGDWTPGLDECISLFVQADNDYIELGRSKPAWRGDREEWHETFAWTAPIYSTLWDVTNLNGAGTNAIQAGTGAGGTAELVTGGAGGPDYESTWSQDDYYSRANKSELTANVRLMTDLAGKEVRVGFCDTLGDGSGCTDYAFFLFDYSADNTDWFYACSDNGSATLNTGPTAGTAQELRVEFSTTGGNARFYVDGTLEDTISGCVNADTALYAFFSIVEEAAAAETLEVDSISVSYDRN